MEMWEDYYKGSGVGEDYYEWSGMGEGRGGTARDKGSPPYKFIGGGSWPPLPTLMHTEIELQIIANTCIW